MGELLNFGGVPKRAQFPPTKKTFFFLRRTECLGFHLGRFQADHRSLAFDLVGQQFEALPSLGRGREDETPIFWEMIFRKKLGKNKKMEIPNCFGEATVGVGFEYVMLRSCSLLIFEQILQNKVGAFTGFQVSVLKDRVSVLKDSLRFTNKPSTCCQIRCWSETFFPQAINLVGVLNAT